MHPGESGEMYLESIYVLSKTKEFVRSIDVCEYMNFSKPSVSRAMGLLKDGGFIDINGKNHITLTETGAALAEKIYERHTVLTTILTSLGIDKEIAAADACKIEHVISDEAFDAIKRHVALMSKATDNLS